MKQYMKLALAEARKAAEMGEVPIGAVVVQGDAVIGRGHNETEHTGDPTAHAEIIALRKAAKHLGGWRLPGCTMVVTCEPCSMCAGAMVWARIERLIIGTMDPKAGACGSVFNIVQEPRLNHRMVVETGVMQEECSRVLTEFFRDLRRQKTEDGQE